MKGTHSALRKAIGAVLIVCAIAYLGYRGYQLFVQMDWNRVRVRPLLFVVGLALHVLGLLTQFVCWERIVNRVGKKISWAEGYGAFCVALAAKYLPAGKVMQFVGIHQSTVEEENRWSAAYALVMLTFLSCLAGFIASIPQATTLFPVPQIYLMVGIGLALLGFVAIQQGWPFRILGRFSAKYLELGECEKVNAGLLLGALFAILGLCWISDAFCYLWSLSILGGTVAWNKLGFLVACNFIAALGGASAVVVPSGIGVRDGIFITLLATQFSMPEAIWLALMVRFFSVCSELIFLAPALIGKFKVKRLVGGDLMAQTRDPLL